MKQSEKLDLILRFLYEKKFDGGYYDISSILQEYNIYPNFQESFALGQRLEMDGYVDALGTLGGMSVCLNTYGVDYIENDSYTFQGQPVITNQYNYTITGSTNSNIIQNSSDISINQNASQVDEIIKSIMQNLRAEFVNKESLSEIEECLLEIKKSAENNIRPKFAFRNLLTMTSEFSSVGSLILSLGQLIEAQ